MHALAEYATTLRKGAKRAVTCRLPRLPDLIEPRQLNGEAVKLPCKALLFLGIVIPTI